MLKKIHIKKIPHASKKKRSPAHSLQPQGGWDRGDSKTGPDPDTQVTPSGPPGGSTARGGRCPPHLGMRQGRAPGSHRQIWLLEDGSVVSSCSAGGRFPSVKITLFCLISQFCKSYC